MSFESPSLTPSLPGAWASTWTLSRAHYAISEKTLPSHDSLQHENPHPAQMEKYRLGSPEVAFMDEHHIVENICGDDDELNEVEDFYSIISHSSQEGTDATLFPSSLSIASELQKPITESDTSNGQEVRIAESMQKFEAVSNINYLQLSSRVHASAAALAREGDCGPDDDVHSECKYNQNMYTPSEYRYVASSAACDNLDQTSASARAHRDSTGRVKRSCHSGTSIIRTPTPLTSSCSSGYHLGGKHDYIVPDPRDKNDDVVDTSGNTSDQSGYSADYAHVRRLINSLDAGKSSRESVHSSLSQRSWHREQRNSRSDHGEDTLHNILHLTQPSGDAPWTLSLDPTALAPSNNSLARQSSRTSSISLSDESSIAFNPSQMHEVMSDENLHSYLGHRSPTTRTPERYYNEDYEIRATRRQPSEYDSSFSSPQTHSFPSMQRSGGSSSPPPFMLYAHQEPARAKSGGVIQKTKALCSRFKKFVTQKSARAKNVQQPVVEYDPYLRRNAMDLADDDYDSRPLPYSVGARPSLSMNGHQGFQRPTKVSTTSIPLVHTWAGHRRTNAMDGGFIYEPSIQYNAVKDTKASRRFSLPAFAGTASNSASSRGLGTFSSIRRPRTGSMLSAQKME